MQSIGSILKLVFVSLILGGLGGLYFLVKKVQNDFGPVIDDSQERLVSLIEDEDLLDFEPGQKEFNRALELIATSRLEEAREKLRFIQQLHPNSKVGPEARRILGEINLDQLLSIENMANKKRHIVKPGDSFFKIVKEYGTTLDNIMFLNGLMEARSLHPGDDVIVMPLDFRLVIDVARTRVELFSENELVKEYPILRMDLPGIGSRVVKAKIALRAGEVRGRPYRATHANYRKGRKILGFKARGSQLQIRPIPEDDEENPGRGVFLSAEDMEELSMLIRLGNEVEIKPEG